MKKIKDKNHTVIIKNVSYFILKKRYFLLFKIFLCLSWLVKNIHVFSCEYVLVNKS